MGPYIFPYTAQNHKPRAALGRPPLLPPSPPLPPVPLQALLPLQPTISTRPVYLSGSSAPPLLLPHSTAFSPPEPSGISTHNSYRSVHGSPVFWPPHGETNAQRAELGEGEGEASYDNRAPRLCGGMSDGDGMRVYLLNPPLCIRAAG